MSCCCIEPEETAELYEVTEIKRARKPHQCCECRRVIPRGAPYRYESALCDGSWGHYHTCKLCAAIRDDRFDCGFTWGELWADLAECLREFGETDTAWLDPPTHPIKVAHAKE